MERHPTNVPGFDSMADLAETVENLRYDQLAAFLLALRGRLVLRAQQDKAAGKSKLASRLNSAGSKLLSVVVEIEAAWSICEPRVPK